MTLVSRSINTDADVAGNIGIFKPVIVSSPTVTWDNSGLATLMQNQPNGTAISEDMRARLSGAGAATATMALETVLGDDAATNGWSISGDDLINAAGTNGQGTLRIKATHNGIDYYSANITWSIVTAQPPDSLAPTPPLIKSLTAPIPSSATVNIMVPVDPKSPTSDADGLVSIAVKRALGAGAFSTVETIAVSPGLSLQFAGTNIGSVSPAPTDTQTGANWEIACAGNEIWNQADDFYYVHATVTGNFQATVKCKEISGVVGGFGMGGIMARASTAAGARFVHCLSMCSPAAGANEYVKGEYRNTLNGTASSVAPKTEGLSGDRYLRLDRVGDLFSMYWQADGTNDWTLLGSISIAMGASCEVGLAVNSNVPGSAMTVNFENFAVQNLADVVHTSTSLVGGSTYNYKCDATDGTNTGAEGPTRSITTPQDTPSEDYEAILDDMVGFAKHWNVTGGAGRAPILVTTLSGSGAGSLRQALTDAGAAGGGWIYFSEGLTGTINGSALAFVENITIDGRGANITVTNASGKGFQGTGEGDANIVLLYLKVDGCGNDCIEADHGSNMYWLYHCTLSDSVDEVLSWRRTLGKWTVQDCKLVNFNSGGRGCLISTDAPDPNVWDTRVQNGTFYRTIFDCNQRQPRITASGHYHMYNCYQTGGNAGGANCAISIATAGALAPEMLFQNNIADQGGRMVRSTGLNLGSGKCKASGNLRLNGVGTAEENDPNNVFIPPYTYSEMVAATTTLRDDLIANAGWQASVNPLH